MSQNSRWNTVSKLFNFSDLHRMLGRHLKQLRYEELAWSPTHEVFCSSLTAARFKSGVHNVEVVPQTMKYGVWGLRKTWIKEVPVPYEPGQKVWGKEKVVVWSKWRREMVVKTKEHSEWVRNKNKQITNCQFEIGHIFQIFQKIISTKNILSRVRNIWLG